MSKTSGLRTRFVLDASGLASTLTEIKGAVGGVIDGFTTVGKEMAGVWDGAGEAAKGVGEAVEVTEREVKAAARAIGFTMDETIERQVERHRQALAVLRDSGKLSAEELERATKDTEAKIGKLYARIGREAEGAEPPVQSLRGVVKDLGSSFKEVKAAGGEFAAALGEVRSAAGTVLRNLAYAKGALLGVAAAATGVAKSAADAADAHIKAGRSLGVATQDYGRLKHAMEQSGVTQGDQALARIAKLATDSVDNQAKATEALTQARGKAAEAQRKVQAATRNADALARQVARAEGREREALARRHAAAVREVERARADLARSQEGIRAAAAKDTDVLKGLGIAVRDARGEMRGTKDILLDIADRFAAMPDGIEKTALAARLFGEEAGPQMINLLNGGRGALLALGAEADALGVTFTDAQGAMAEGFNDALDRMGKSFAGVKNSLGFVFMPLLTEAADAITEFVTTSREAITSFVRAGWEKAAEVVRDVVAVLQGRDADVKNSWVIEARDSVMNFARSAQQALTTIIIPAFHGMMGVLNSFAGTVNAVLGTEFTGQTMGIALAVGKLSGAFGLLGAVVGTIGPGIAFVGKAMAFLADPMKVIGPALQVVASGFMSLAPVLAAITTGVKTLTAAILMNPIGLLVAAVAAAAVLIVMHWDEIKAAGLAVWESIAGAASAAWDTVTGTLETAKAAFLEGFARLILAAVEGWEAITAPGRAFLAWLEGVGDALRDALTAPFRAAGDAIAAIWTGLMEPIQKVIDMAKQAVSVVTSALGGGKSGASANDNLPRKAGGGPIVGPGTGTSDSVLMWGSNGEYMIRAASVRKYGRALLDAINSGRFTLPAFSTGGLVDFGDRLAASLMPASDTFGPALAGAAAGVTPGGAGQGRDRMGGTVVLDLGGGRQHRIPTTADALDELRRSGLRQIGPRPRGS